MQLADRFITRHSLFLGLGLMFILTWPVNLADVGIFPFQIPGSLTIFLGWGFVAAAVIMTALTTGRLGVISLLKRYLIWRVHWKGYLSAIFLVPFLMLAGVYGSALLKGSQPDFSTAMALQLFGDKAALPLFILPFFLVDFITNGEEIGWRGYLLPRLQEKYSSLVSALIIGVFWGFWHIPRYLPHFDLPAFSWFMVHTLSFSVLLAWLYNHTRGSLLLVTICHASANTAGMFLPLSNHLPGPRLDAYILFALLEASAAMVVTIWTVSRPRSQSSTHLLTGTGENAAPY